MQLVNLAFSAKAAQVDAENAQLRQSLLQRQVSSQPWAPVRTPRVQSPRT